MSFHKRWISKQGLVSQYSSSGIEGVKMYLRADALMIEDEFSDTILKFLNENKEEEASKLFEKELTK